MNINEMKATRDQIEDILEELLLTHRDDGLSAEDERRIAIYADKITSVFIKAI